MQINCPNELKLLLEKNWEVFFQTHVLLKVICGLKGEPNTTPTNKFV